MLGETIYEGIVRNAYSIHMLFYCAGGLLWYGLFYRSGYLPRAIPLFGLVAVILALGGTVLQLLGASVPIVVFMPLFPFELLIGGWLLLRGIETDARGLRPARTSRDPTPRRVARPPLPVSASARAGPGPFVVVAILGAVD